MYCPNCGTENENGALFCAKCGTRLDPEPAGARENRRDAYRDQSAGRDAYGRDQYDRRRHTDDISGGYGRNMVYDGGGGGRRPPYGLMVIAAAVIVVILLVVLLLLVRRNAASSGDAADDRSTSSETLAEALGKDPDDYEGEDLQALLGNNAASASLEAPDDGGNEAADPAAADSQNPDGSGTGADGTNTNGTGTGADQQPAPTEPPFGTGTALPDDTPAVTPTPTEQLPSVGQNPATPAPTKAPTSAPNSTDGLIFPDSDSRYLTDSEVAALSSTQIRYAINDLYARHGYKFKKKEMQDHYQQFSWYSGYRSDMEAVVADFNKYENANLNLLTKYR